MAPQKTHEHTEFYTTDHPTSPWTEPYQTSEMEAVRDEQATMSQRDFDRDTQTPTHDALSDIYNRVS
jgi:arylamine N-acetyltransferase